MLDVESAEALRAAFVKCASGNSLFNGWTLYAAQELPSTMDAARTARGNAAANAGFWQCPLGESSGQQEKHGEIYYALSQTAGRGRNNRSWNSPPGKGIYATYVFFPRNVSSSLAGLSLSAGLAVQNTVERYGVNVTLKWPNDVLVEDCGSYRKLAGVLVDVMSGGTQLESVHIGIGLNLFRREFPADVPGISLEEILAGPPEAAEVFASLSSELLQLVSGFFRRGFAEYADTWNTASGLRGKQVAVRESKSAETVTDICRVLGVCADGSLQVESADGEIRRLYSAEIFLLPEAS
jgi:BirA family biotin operon repressor/biotin-[acetyl-CoA-carboxylase] ligase